MMKVFSDGLEGLVLKDTNVSWTNAGFPSSIISSVCAAAVVVVVVVAHVVVVVVVQKTSGNLRTDFADIWTDYEFTISLACIFFHFSFFSSFVCRYSLLF